MSAIASVCSQPFLLNVASLLSKKMSLFPAPSFCTLCPLEIIFKVCNDLFLYVFDGLIPEFITQAYYNGIEVHRLAQGSSGECKETQFSLTAMGSVIVENLTVASRG